MSEASRLITRRVFLEGLGVTTVGLYFSAYALAETKKPTTEPSDTVGKKPAPKQQDVEDRATGLNPNVFVHLAPSGVLTIMCHRSEMGQGIRSSLPILIADELGADMEHVVIKQADGDKAYGDQNTDGSNSVRGIYEDMRKVAATARMMLISAAAKKMNVPEDHLEARDHFVVQRSGGKKISFGDLATQAGELPIPQPNDVKLRPDEELKHIGGNLALLDAPAYVSGVAQYGADVRKPGMLIAVIARPPVVGGKHKKFNKAASLKVGGVKHVVEMPHPKPPYGFQPWGGVAVVAETTWAAIKGRDHLQVSWDAGKNGSYNSESYKATLFKSVRAPGKVLRNVGDVDKAMKGAAKTVEAEYYVPHLPHVAMEPPAALASYTAEKGGSCEVWTSTQNPQAAQTEVARVLGISEDRVTVHVTFLGGGFGRKSKADFCSEAAYLSKKIGVPVRVQFTREDDIHNDYVNAVSAQRLVAGLDEKGQVIAWHHRTAFPPIGSTFDAKVNEPGLGDLQQGVLDVALSVPNVRAEGCKADAHVRVGWLRSVYNIFHAFAVNSFIDEIAHARGLDPLDNMLEIYGPARIVSLKKLGVSDLKNYGQSLDKHPVDAGRLRGVIETVAKSSDWKKRVHEGKGTRALGIAAHRSFNSYTAVVASVVKRPDGLIGVEEVWIAVDPAKILNPDRVRAQMEGSVINGMNHLLYGGVTHKHGAVEQNNFDGVNLTRIAFTPAKIHVDIVTSKNAPGGVGEPGVPPTAPAIANAIFALTGRRIREFGLNKMGLV